MRFISVAALLLISFSLYAEQKDKKIEPATDSQSIHHMSIAINGRLRLNDDFGISYSTFRPSFFYRYSEDPIRLSVLVGGVYNRIDFAAGISQRNALVFGGDSLFIFGGDRPRIGGQDLDLYEFDGNRFVFYGGWQMKFPHENYPATARLLVENSAYAFSEPPANAGFTMPKNFFDVGPIFRIEAGKGNTTMELNDYGIRALLLAGYKKRINAAAWGDAFFSRNISQWLEGSLGLTGGIPLSSRFVLVSKIQGSFISSVDRINAIRDGTLQQEAAKIGMADVKSDRSGSAEVGFRWHFEKPLVWALKPFIHSVIYREITPLGCNSEEGIGLGLKAMGLFKNGFYWELQYGNLFGTRPDLSGIHELYAGIRYTFWPLPKK